MFSYIFAISLYTELVAEQVERFVVSFGDFIFLFSDISLNFRRSQCRADHLTGNERNVLPLFAPLYISACRSSYYRSSPLFCQRDYILRWRATATLYIFILRTLNNPLEGIYSEPDMSATLSSNSNTEGETTSVGEKRNVLENFAWTVAWREAELLRREPGEWKTLGQVDPGIWQCLTRFQKFSDSSELQQ